MEKSHGEPTPSVDIIDSGNKNDSKLHTSQVKSHNVLDKNTIFMYTMSIWNNYLIKLCPNLF